MERHQIGIVIPALNEAATIGSVVSSVWPYGVPIVVDDGSTDDTSARAAAAGAEVVRHGVNRGYDTAIDSGFAHALRIQSEYVITMDADGQHDPLVLRSFIQALEGGAEVVLGIRDRCPRVAEHVFSWIGRIKWGVRDPLCGMKAYAIGVYKELGHFDSYDSIGTELAIYAAKHKKRIVQLPVKTRDRVGQPRFGRRFSANTRIFRALWLAMMKQY